jgi:tmRNA-binding protein
MLQAAQYLSFMIFMLSIQNHVQRGAGNHVLKKFELERFSCCRLHGTSILWFSCSFKTTFNEGSEAMFCKSSNYRSCHVAGCTVPQFYDFHAQHSKPRSTRGRKLCLKKFELEKLSCCRLHGPSILWFSCSAFKTTFNEVLEAMFCKSSNYRSCHVAGCTVPQFYDFHAQHSKPRSMRGRKLCFAKVQIIEVVMLQVARYLNFMIFMLSIQNHVQRGVGSYVWKSSS